MINTTKFFVILMAASLLLGFSGENPDTQEPTPIDILAAYIHEAKYGDFPEEVTNRAKYLILDSIGCALGGTQLDLGKDYLKLGKNWPGGSEATLIGTGTRVSLLNAAYVNSQLANVLDFDDTYDLYAPGHPGCGIVQTALAAAEAKGVSGLDLLTAVILGYEICLRMGRAEGPFDWQSPIFVDTMTRGTAAVAARLFGLTQAEIVTALRHAAEQPPGRRQKFDVPADMVIPEIKSNYGLYAIKGILAVRLAQQRIEGWESVLQGNLKKWYFAGGEIENYRELTEGLGHVYRLMEVSFKPTPTCRLTHAPITALWEALDHQPLKSEDVTEIIIKGVERLNRPEWETWLQAQFSMQCAAALAASGTEPGPGWYTTGRFNDPDIKELAGKVKLENDPEAEELEIKALKVKCSVQVKLKDGTVKEATIYHIKGAPGNPLTDKELRAKFRANTGDILAEDRIETIIDRVLNLEKLPRAATLTQMLVSPKLK
jgi:2-methylcitrate dehydratase PrpD